MLHVFRFLLLPVMVLALSASFASNHSERPYESIEDFMEKYTFGDLFNEKYNEAVDSLITKYAMVAKMLDDELIETKRQLRIVTMINELRKTLQEFDKESMFDFSEKKQLRYDALMYNRLFTIASSVVLSFEEKIDLFDYVAIEYPEFLSICERSLEVAEDVEKMKPELRNVSQALRHAYLLVLRLQMEIHNEKLVAKIYEKLEELVRQFSPRDHKDLVRLLENYLADHEDFDDEKLAPFDSLIETYKNILFKK